MSEIRTHKWTEAGHGSHPFKVIGLASLPSKALAEANPSAYNAAMKALPKGYGLGSCAICGQALTNNYLIKSADGRKFAVGCDCVAKAGDTRLTTETKLAKRRAAEKRRREERQAQQDRQYLVWVASQEAARGNNWGLTPREVIEIIRQADKERKQALLSGLSDLLHDGKRGFRDDIAKEMGHGVAPWGRAGAIVTDILAKMAGRKGSAAYEQRAAEVAAILESAK